MDSLADYNSSDDSLEAVSNTTVQNSTDAGHNKSAETLVDPITERKSATLSEIERLIPYLDNYNMNKNNLLSGFILLPWTPHATLVKRLQNSTRRAVQVINQQFPELKPRYDWHFTGSNKPVVFGRYGYTNVGAVNSLHISMFPNFYGEKHRFSQLKANLKRAVRNFSPTEGIIKEKSSSAIEKMLLQSEIKKVISLRTNRALRCYMSSKSGTVFVALDICEKDGEEMLREYKFLRQITRLVEDQVNVLDFKYDWKTMVANPSKRLEDDLPWIRYHVTVLIGEIQFFDRRLKLAEFRRLKQSIESCDVSQDLCDVTVDIENLRIRNIAGQSIDINLVGSLEKI